MNYLKMYLFSFIISLFFFGCKDIAIEIKEESIKKDVIIIAGQSNAEGINLVSTLPTNLSNEFETTMIYYKPTTTNIDDGEWQKLKVGVNNQTPTRLIYYGSEIQIANLWNQNVDNKNLCIVKYAVGSSALTSISGNDWNANSTNELLDRLLNDYVDKALQKLENYNLKAFIWMQGEADGFVLSDANAYEANLTALISKVRTVLANPTLPFIIGRCSIKSMSNRPFGNTIRTAQSNVVANVSNCYLINTDGYGMIDAVHFEQIPFGTDIYNLLYP